MKILIVKLNVPDKIEAYKVVSHLGFEYEILEADLDGDSYIFDKKVGNKDFKYFLRDDFGKPTGEIK
jgi:hypothetical protein